MAVFREKSQKVIELEKRKGNQQPDPTERVVDICYAPNDKLVQLVVDAWTDNDIKDRLLDKTECKALLAERGVFLKNPIVIDEDNYRTNMTIADNQVVFVCPTKIAWSFDRAKIFSSRPLADVYYPERHLRR